MPIALAVLPCWQISKHFHSRQLKVFSIVPAFRVFQYPEILILVFSDDLPPEEEPPWLRTSSLSANSFLSGWFLSSSRNCLSSCLGEQRDRLQDSDNSSVFLCELWLTKECQFGSYYTSRTAILGYLYSEYSHKSCLWIQNQLLPWLRTLTLWAITFTSDCVGWCSSIYSSDRRE